MRLSTPVLAHEVLRGRDLQLRRSWLVLRHGALRAGMGIEETTTASPEATVVSTLDDPSAFRNPGPACRRGLWAGHVGAARTPLSFHRLSISKYGIFLSLSTYSSVSRGS